MSRRLVVTRRAMRDLRRIRDHIAQDSPLNADRFVAGLEADLKKLVPYPLMAEAAASHSRFRRYPYGAYVVFYEVTEATIFIRSVEHSATLK